jgi:hypothetical protein
MNFAAVNLQFRGFQQAEEAYRAALKMKADDFDAHLGLALALRGQIDDSNFDKMVAAAAAELAAAKKIAPDRPETYYNEAILTQEYKAKSGGKDSESALLAAKGLFGQFVTKAGPSKEFEDAVKRSKERMVQQTDRGRSQGVRARAAAEGSRSGGQDRRRDRRQEARRPVTRRASECLTEPSRPRRSQGGNRKNTPVF